MTKRIVIDVPDELYTEFLKACIRFNVPDVKALFRGMFKFMLLVVQFEGSAFGLYWLDPEGNEYTKVSFMEMSE